MSITKVTYSMISGASINVMDFGAKGDGTTNDTAAIQAAITYAESTATPPSAAPGVVQIYFPFGIYIISSALTVTKSLSFVGEGHSEYSTGARIIQNTSATDHFNVQPISAGCSVSWDSLTMTANGGGGTGGACINITKTTAACNSVRIRGCTFGTPQSFAIKIQGSDDIQIEGNLFDVSATGCISLGTSTSTDVVSNCAITNNAFFSIANIAITAYNVDGLIVANNRVYPNASNLGTFIDGYNTLPYQLKNIIVDGNSFKGVNCLAQLKDVKGLVFSCNNGVSLGAGSGATLSCIELAGTCSNVAVTGNSLSGSFDTQNFYNDLGATTVSVSIAANSFINTAGTGAAIVASNSSGCILENGMTGFVTYSVGQQWYTSGNAISPGTINSLASYTYTTTVTGTTQGDKVTLTPASTSWPAPAGIIVTAFISAPNTVSIQYTNVTGSPIGVGAHDFGILVTR